MVFRRNAFKLKIISLLLVFTLIPILLANGIWYRTATESVEKLAMEKSESTMQQLSMNIQNYVNGIEISVMNVVCDDDVKEILHSGSTLDVEDYKANQEKLQKELNMAVYNNMTISRISMITDLYHVDSTGEKINIDKFENEKWYQAFKASGKFIDFTGIYETDYGHGKQEATIAYLQRITRPPTVQLVGVLVVEIRYSKIKRLFQDIVEDGEHKLFVFDNDKIIYSPDGYFDASKLTSEQKKLIEDTEKLENGESYQYQDKDYVLIKKEIVSTGWTVVELLDKNILFSVENQTINHLNVMFICLVAILAIFSLFIIYHMLKPLRQIEKYMQKIQQNQLDARFKDITKDEFGQIKSGFNRMMDHITRLLTDVEKKEEEKREIAIQTLRAQINPHFLYNTLNIIRWKAILAGNDTVGEMIVTLIRALEFNGNRKEEFVTVRDEIDNVRNYIHLLEYHYTDRFEVVWELDEKAMECYICKLLLQPLVENAVFHGIIPKNEKGTIRICAKRVLDEIFFTVADNGVGMTGEQEKNIYQGIGFSNVNDRIKYYYGKEHGITVQNIYGKGVAMNFSIPVVTALPYYRAVIRKREDDIC